jgi:hypothetical protein
MAYNFVTKYPTMITISREFDTERLPSVSRAVPYFFVDTNFKEVQNNYSTAANNNGQGFLATGY